MRFLYTVLPLLGAVALAQDLVGDQCQCPQAKCPGDDAVALCKCLNGRETLCKERCPDYKPTYLPCPIPAPSPTPTPKPTYIATLLPAPTPKPTSKPAQCECLQINCLQVWPGSCHCANAAKQRCFDDCGGKQPDLQDCGDGESFAIPPVPDVLTNAIAPVAEAEPELQAQCVCDDIMCVQMWPQSCYCANAAAEACATKCGRKAALQECPPQVSRTLTTKTRTSSSTPKPTPTLPIGHAICGGGRGNYLFCDEGYACITDPYTPGCGPACDGLGICVKDKMCGGFPGFTCEEKNMICHDDPRDDCDPKTGGSDCAGLCVWPHGRIDGVEEGLSRMARE